MGFREVGDAFLEVFERVRADEADLVDGWTGEVEVRVLEAGDDEAAVEINDRGVVGSQLLDVGVRADCDQFVSCDGEGLGTRLRVVAGPDFAVQEDAVDMIGGEGVTKEQNPEQTFHGCFVGGIVHGDGVSSLKGLGAWGRGTPHLRAGLASGVAGARLLLLCLTTAWSPSPPWISLCVGGTRLLFVERNRGIISISSGLARVPRGFGRIVFLYR